MGSGPFPFTDRSFILGRMGEVLPMPRIGDVFADVRGGGRTMRVSYHDEQRTVVVSLWVGAMCRGTFRMASPDVTRLLSMLREIGLLADSAEQAGRPPTGSAGEVSRGSNAGLAVAPRQAAPPFDETGEIAGDAHMTWLPSGPPVPGVA